MSKRSLRANEVSGLEGWGLVNWLIEIVELTVSDNIIDFNFD